jgi:hypothetical protein
MKKHIFSSRKTMGSVGFSFLCMAAMALVIFVTPNGAQSTDRLVVTDSSTPPNTMFAAGDNGTIRVNSNAFNGPPWAIIYGSSNNSNTGFTLDSYGSTNLTTSTGTAYAYYGGGGNFRFARGTQAAPTVVGIDDRLGFFVFSGYDGANWLNTAGIMARVDGAVTPGSAGTTGNIPTKLVFKTNAIGGTIPERLLISSVGNIVIGGDLLDGNGIPEVNNGNTYPIYVATANGAYLTSGGQWSSPSSRALKENINTLTTEEANQALDGLSPVKYNYKVDKEEKHVGFIAEDVPDLVATKDRKGLIALDIVAVLTKVVQEQKNTIAEQTNLISELSKRLDTMQQEINRVKGINIVGSIESIK